MLSKREILAHVWDFSFDDNPNIVDAYARRPRTSWTCRSRGRRSSPCEGPATGWPPITADHLRRARASLRGSMRLRTACVGAAVVGVTLLAGAIALVAVLVREGEVRSTASLRAAQAARALQAGADLSRMARPVRRRKAGKACRCVCCPTVGR
ncbi:MAG TPA: hypothetical protein VFB84_20790 [Micromonosporaceae bacterium]|nr:hypothetical protein [Micromonosporaceae bacterium]